MLHAHLQLHEATSHVTKTLRLFTNALQHIPLILLQLLQSKFHLHNPTMKVSNSRLCCASNHLRPHTPHLQMLWLQEPFQRRISRRQAMQVLCLRPQCRRGHLHQALDSCQSFKHGIVFQSRHTMSLHLPLNRSQASGHGVMLRRARLKSNQTPRHVMGDVRVSISHTTSSW
ncbi:hypothetical protein H257_14152 [Aphanomyces astaci]|uniref:Uncharacterized protein n=1 Tax=Aphanomyces astaci TaxID=112090 RepID=W4FSP9_APHAT|nr:hypothetical protein H257_14152 [Aphanomyces astaci]ETV70497.1 hypothetical protein H257_14152 [Aphanomyces astaci]RHY88197.1 hypothetical protein DYB35_013630 [Aphanomyces astaci]RHZ12741.1 hypothetical protein DYB37_013992 [Aphanomyces astaci]RQM12856.1 hypothetical protein B5M09_013923 [Aphanomyces astaci]|eukprot:XP_009840209.1 hypothetical protein H257_14152 [Aphanomyces astaci]